MVSLCKVTRTDTHESTRFCTELEVVTVAVAGKPLGPVDILVAPVEQKFHIFYKVLERNNILKYCKRERKQNQTEEVLILGGLAN